MIFTCRECCKLTHECRESQKDMGGGEIMRKKNHPRNNTLFAQRIKENTEERHKMSSVLQTFLQEHK